MPIEWRIRYRCRDTTTREEFLELLKSRNIWYIADSFISTDVIVLYKSAKDIKKIDNEIKTLHLPLEITDKL